VSPRRVRRVGAGAFCLWLALSGCDRPPGKPDPASPPADPFASVWGEHCGGCHGADGGSGPARNLDDPLYWAIAVDEDVLAATRSGVPGTAMPAFGRAAGGPLTEPQLAELVAAMRTRWARPERWAGVELPGYRGAGGSAARGAGVFGAFCADCHGADGSGGERGGSVVDGSYLRLASRQALRLAVICGRSDLGAPDWRGMGTRPMTGREIDDVVAWLGAQRVEADPSRGAAAPEARH
jgi:cytochrome c oxidase cbb3-type subunit 3/ubiquinol-cytochrome c reductase cytochrome c subunit